MSAPNDGGPAFPSAPIVGATDIRNEQRDGLSLRDYLAAAESVREWDNPDAAPSKNMCEALAGRPMPESGWGGDVLAMLRFEAEWRAALKYLRADAMIAERAKEKS